MRRGWFFIVFIGLGLVFSPRPVLAQATSLKLNVVTYNIKLCFGGIDHIAKTLAAQHPDIVFLQEVHGPNFVEGFNDQSQVIADYLGFYHAFGRAESWITGEYGLAILSRYPLSDKKVVELPNLPGEEQKILLMVTAATPLGKIALANTHWTARAHVKGHSARELRREQARVVFDEIMKTKEPLVFGGDLNSFRWSREVRHFSRHLLPVFKIVGRGRSSTFPAFFPILQRDYLFTRGTIFLHRARVVRSGASDHRPLWSEMELMNTYQPAFTPLSKDMNSHAH